jgi:DNA-binding transcriptional LysR family regulator
MSQGPRSLDLRQLETFLLVAEERNFTRAAARLSLTQPAVTRQIMSLERELQTRLFERLGREVRLTAAGRALRIYADRILRLCDDARAALSDVASGSAGDVTVGATSTLATYLLPRVISEFRSCYPRIELTVSTGASSRILRLVEENEVDLGLVASELVPSPLVEVPLCDYRTVAIVPSHHHLAGVSDLPIERLACEPLILMKQGTYLRRHVDRLLQSAGVRAKTVMELDNVEVLKKMVETGLGVSLVPEVAVREEVAAGRVAALRLEQAAEPQRQVTLVYRGDRYLTASIRALMELIKAQVGA